MPNFSRNRLGKAVGSTLAPRSSRASGGKTVQANWKGVGPPPISFEWLVVAGGGAGGSNSGSNYGAGGGGAGGYRSSVGTEYSGGGGATESPITTGTGAFTITVGGAGSASSIARSGMTTISTTPGGAGGSGAAAGSSGGSGGGGAVFCQSYGWYTTGGGTGTGSQGYNGASGPNGSAYQDGRCFHQGHKGAGANAGTNGTTAGQSGDSNLGMLTYITTAAGIYLGQGGGVTRGCTYCDYYLQFIGVNGAGGPAQGNAPANPANSGGGGNAYSQSGSSGTVIIRHPNTFAPASDTTGSPIQTDAQGFTVYQFTGNGTITF